jgi:hypothetical protein
MKIKILGINDYSSEYKAAIDLKDILDNQLSQLKGEIYIKPNLTLLGNNAEQLDLLVWGEFENGFTTPYNLFCNLKDPNNNFELTSAKYNCKVSIKNFFLVIEVKDQSNSKIKTQGSDLFVQYSKERYVFEWSNASDQSKKQVHTVRNGLYPLLKKNNIDNKYCPQVSNFIWLRNVVQKDVQHLGLLNLLPSSFDSKYFFQIIAQTNPPVGLKSPTINFIRGKIENSIINKIIKEFFESFEKEIYLKSGALTRKKLEEVIQNQINIEEKPYFDKIGKQLIIINGDPGSGKTIHLFQIAFSLYSQQRKRCLLMTYNKALEADLNRLSYLSGINNDSYNPTVKVQTIQSFFYYILIAYDIFNPKETDFLANYEKLLYKLDEIVEADWIDEVEKQKIKTDVIKFNWDHILIDESQDWLEQERNILYKLFEPQNFVIAYGDRQFVRQNKGVKWDEYKVSNEIKKVDIFKPIINLTKSYRQKSNLIQFQNKLFDNYSWKLKTNNELLGGEVSIYSNPFAKIDLETILNDLQNQNAAPFDLLMLMPKSYYNSINQLKVFKEWGFDGIDGVDKVGKILENDINKFRCFQYESCRGLEGWVVVCHWFDEFLQTKYDFYTRDVTVQSNMTDEEAKMKFVTDWAFLATSRAINQLIITLKDPKSKFAKILIEAGSKNQDFTILD